MTEIIVAVLGVFGTGVGVWGYLSTKNTNKVEDHKVENDESKIAIQALQKVINDQAKRAEKMDSKIEDMGKVIQDTNEKVSNLQVEIATWACYKTGCKLRNRNESNNTKNSKKA